MKYSTRHRFSMFVTGAALLLYAVLSPCLTVPLRKFYQSCGLSEADAGQCSIVVVIVLGMVFLLACLFMWIDGPE